MAKSNVEKPKVEEVPDFHGKPNPYVPKATKPVVKDEAGKKGLGGEPKVEEIPDFHGKPNPDAKETPMPKNVKKSQVVEVRSFKEYIDAKGKNKEAVVTINFKDFPKSDSPPSGGPYVGKAMTPKEDLGSMGTIPAWNPKTCPCKDTQEFETLKKTKDSEGSKQLPESIKKMSLVEMTSFLANQNKLLCEGEEAEDIPKVTSWATGKIMPDPLETVEYISHLASMNANLMEILVQTLKKKQGGFGGLVSKVLDQPESMKELVGHLEGEHGERHAGGLCRAMSDSYNSFKDEHTLDESALSPPIGFEDEEDEEDEEGHGLDDEAAGDEGEGGDDNYEDLDGLGDEFPDDGEGEDEEGQDQDEPSFPDEAPPELPKRKKKLFSHDHLIGAMAGHKHMRDAMAKQCKNCGEL